MKTLDECRRFYEKSVAPMIHGQFPAYEDRIAVGLAGEGSECWGFDDLLSRDHDFGISVCLWLTDKDFGMIGQELEKAYRKTLPYSPDGSRLTYRRGVQTISGFYRSILGILIDPDAPEMTEAQWMHASDNDLAAAVNGEVFRDDAGAFTRIRSMLANHYPDRVMKMKLVNALHGYAASLQANYPRCMARQDSVAALTCVSKGIMEAMQIAFLLNRTYMPYYKWSYRALERIGEENPAIRELTELLRRLSVTGEQSRAWENYRYDPYGINDKDEVQILGEEIAGVLTDLLFERGLTDNRERFLEAHCGTIAKGIR
jgi:hypothetical protein